MHALLGITRFPGDDTVHNLGTEAAFLAVLFAFNLLSLYQKRIAPKQPYRQPATLRS